MELLVEGNRAVDRRESDSDEDEGLLWHTREGTNNVRSRAVCEVYSASIGNGVLGAWAGRAIHIHTRGMIAQEA